MNSYKSKIYCVGIEAIKQYGVKKWHNEFFLPISSKDYDLMCEKIYKVYRSILISNISWETKNVMYVMWKIIFKYIHFLHRYILHVYLRDKGYHILSSDDDGFYKFGEEEAKRIIGKHIFTGVKLCFINISNYFMFPSHKKALNIGARSRIKKIYSLHNRFSLHEEAFYKLLKLEDDIPKYILAEIEHIIEEFLDLGETILEDFGFRGHNKHFLSEIKKELLSDLMLAMRLYLGAVSKCRDLQYKYILADSLGNLFVRLVLKALQVNGKEVVGFTHGNILGLIYNKILLMNELTVLNRYVVFSKSAAEFFDNLMKLDPLFPLPTKPSIELVRDTSFRKMWRKGKKTPVPRKTRRVMFIEYPLTPFRYMFYGSGFYLIQLDLALRVLEVLKRRGYYVLIKLHPDRLKESDNGMIYRDFVDECVMGRFENTYYKADAFIFPHLLTTTFAFSLATNKKVVYLLYEKEKYIPEKLNLLNKRCIPVYCWFDDRNRIRFDEAELVDALEKECYPLDTKFLENYLF